MAEEKTTTKKPRQTKSSLVGVQAKPTTLDKTTKIDIDVSNTLIDNVIEAGINGGLDIGALESFTSISNARSQVYQLIDTMAADSNVSAILKTYAEEVCEVADNGHIVWCESADPKISKFVNYLLNVMNVDKNIYAWVYCLLKYGDTYLKLYRESDYDDPLFAKDKINTAYSAKTSLNENLKNDKDVNEILNDNQQTIDEAVNLNIHTAGDKYSYYVEMVADPGSMFELTKFGRTYGFIETPNETHGMDYLSNYTVGGSTNAFISNYRMKSNDVNIYQADDYVHACLDDNFSRFPETVDLFRDEEALNAGKSTSYTVKRGKSLLYDSYKVWREKSLLENAILLNRLTKSSIVRNIQVEVGDMPKSQVQNTLRRIKELFEQKSAISTDNGMVEYTNPGPVENNIFTAVHNGQGAITVNAVGGDIEVKNLGDLDQWITKFYAGFGVPKQFFGETSDSTGFNGGTSLSIISSVFAKSVKRVQNSILQAITDAINLFLLNKGCTSYINQFVLKMKAPLTQEEKDYREDLTNRINAISSMQALFADVEDKSRKLEILKSLLSTLNYGDNLIAIIQEEIDATEAAKKEEAEAAKAENASNEANTETATEETTNNEDTDLGNSGDLPLLDTTEESFIKVNSGTILTEDQILNEQIDFLAENDVLPTPDEVNENKDFTKNE